MMQDGSQDFQDVARLEDVEEKLFIVLTKLPKEDEKLLVELNFPLGIRQIGMRKGIHQ